MDVTESDVARVARFVYMPVGRDPTGGMVVMNNDGNKAN